MASAPSPSEFLTFYRLAAASTRTLTLSAHPTTATATAAAVIRTAPFRRAFAVSAVRPAKQYPDDLSTNEKTKTDLYPDDEHATRKRDRLNIQEDSVGAGMDAHKHGEGGHATERKDSAGGVKKAKEEHPEAPDPAIGMQDERGGRGA